MRKNKAADIWLSFAIERAIPKFEHVQESQTELNKADLLKLLYKKPNFFSWNSWNVFQPTGHSFGFWYACQTLLCWSSISFPWVGAEASIFGDRPFLYPLCGQNFHQQYSHHWEKRVSYSLFCLQWSKIWSKASEKHEHSGFSQIYMHFCCTLGSLHSLKDNIPHNQLRSYHINWTAIIALPQAI